ncbi:hypothetical protein BGX33_002860 [Mortierella sp. NVP41]|nr:hypothetical protein BGX33_002860 [Mortierella sp. NVP41]
MTNPSEIESHPVDTHVKDHKHQTKPHNPLEVEDRPIPAQAMAGLNVIQGLRGPAMASADIIGVPHIAPHEHKHGSDHHHHHDKKPVEHTPAQDVTDKIPAQGFQTPPVM